MSILNTFIALMELTCWSVSDWVLPKNTDRAFHGETLRENHDLILGFANKDIDRLSKFQDIPIEYYQWRWKQATEKERGQNQEAGKALSGADNAVPVENAGKPEDPKAAQFKGALMREANREKRSNKLKATLPGTDARNGGVRCAPMENMEKLRETALR